MKQPSVLGWLEEKRLRSIGLRICLTIHELRRSWRGNANAEFLQGGFKQADKRLFLLRPGESRDF
jgi:hypothetical protein